MTTATETKRPTRAEILAADDRATEDIDVPSWGGILTVRALSGTERDRYEGGSVVWGKDDKGAPVVESMTAENMRARLVSLTVVDEAGRRLFTDADVVALGAKNAANLDRVFEVARRLSGLTSQDVKGLVAGLEPGPNASSGSD